MNLDRHEVLSNLRRMDEYNFEHFIADLWEKQGWDTKVSQASKDRGVDVIAKKSSPFPQKHLLQVKRYNSGNTVGVREIREYSSLKNRDNVDSVIIVTTSSFTKSAKTEADSLNVKLIDCSNIIDIISEVHAQDLLNEYTDIGKSDSDSINSTGESTSDQQYSQNNPTESNSNFPDRFEKDSITDELGSICPKCYEEDSIWWGKTVNTDPMLVCEECGTKWGKKEEKTGIIFGSTVIKWSKIGSNKRLTPDEWKERGRKRKS